MNAKSVKRVFGLAASAVGTTGVMMLVPTVANAATAHPVHAQTVSSVSRASGYEPCDYTPYGGNSYTYGGNSYMPNEGNSYMPNEGNSYTPNGGNSYTPNEGNSYTPNGDNSSYKPSEYGVGEDHGLLDLDLDIG